MTSFFYLKATINIPLHLGSHTFPEFITNVFYSLPLINRKLFQAELFSDIRIIPFQRIGLGDFAEGNPILHKKVKRVYGEF